MKDRKRDYLAGLFDYIKYLCEKSIREDLKIIIWGYGKGGGFLRYLIQEYDQRVKIEYIIDQYMYVPSGCQPRIYRRTLLEYINSNDYILLSTVINYSDVKQYAEKFGFVDGVNIFDVRKKIGVSYIDYLTISKENIDFAPVTAKERPDIYYNTGVHISTAFEGTSLDKLFAEISKLEDDIYLFDFGCGKGQILFAAYLYGIDKLGGAELVQEIAEQGKNNLERLNISAKISCCDATKYEDLDDINVFFFNNPFKGDIFKQVINNIVESIRNNPRRIHIVYLNPICNSTILESGMFKLDRQLYADVGDPLVNFYVSISDDN